MKPREFWISDKPTNWVSGSDSKGYKLYSAYDREVSHLTNVIHVREVTPADEAKDRILKKIARGIFGKFECTL